MSSGRTSSGDGVSGIGASVAVGDPVKAGEGAGAAGGEALEAAGGGDCGLEHAPTIAIRKQSTTP